ncbi:cell wall-binding repeat-containing protein [Desulfosporosinus sp. OT]|uniref:cell wall-binding repeat-containing protein n=1 Tax=Desulfosporosinus sp. OT TaxID=913865 RepID=UPI000223A03A|nr:cell wall-binding repeat-containing protein [Desulfosporosinus sp. OT]EGW37958.1 cell wall binding repeat 2 family protein [Desulfosporosinus sp. OT]
MKRKTKVLLSFVCMVSLIFSCSLVAQASRGKSASHRFYGQDRFQTSTSIASELDDDQQVQNIVLASAYNFPDALSASTLAYKLKAPIILVSLGYEDSMQSYNFVKDHLVAGGTITIIGGTGIISQKSEQWLLKNGLHVNRLGGKDRFETNALILNKLNVPKGTPVIIASATNFPDALGVSSLAASKGWPILLSNPSNLTQSVQDFLSSDKPTNVYVVGGEGVIHNGVSNQIKNLSPNSQIQRLGGYDRFETLSLILNKFYPNPTEIYVANGFDFADALSGSTLAATHNAPILLVDPKKNNLPKSIYDYLITLRNNNVQPQVNVLGGEAAVPQHLIEQINDILQSSEGTTNPSTNSVTFTVSNPTTNGFTVAMSPALDGLKVNNFTLLDNWGDPIAIRRAVTSDDGVTYVITAALSEGQIYTLTAAKTGYKFGTAQYVVVPAITPTETLTVREPSTAGFTVALKPALNGLDASDFILLDGTTRVMISSASTTNRGATYNIAATLSVGRTYTITAIKSGHYFGSAQNVFVPSAATVSRAVISDRRHITLTMSKDLTGSIGDPEAFKVAGVASDPKVTNVVVFGTRVTLTLSSSIVSTDSHVTLNYVKTGIRDLTSSSAPVANFNIHVVNE